MKLLRILLLLTIANCAFGQIDLEKRLMARKIKTALYVKLINDNLVYKIDNHRDLSFGAPLKSNDPKQPIIFGAKYESFQLIFDFYNPLKYRIAVNQDQKLDPTYEDANRFLDVLTALVKKTTSDVTIESLKSEDAPSSTEKREPSKPQGVTNPLKTLTDEVKKNKTVTPSILNWLLWITSQKKVCSESDTTKLHNVYKIVLQIEKNLYGKVAATDLTFQDHTQTILPSIYNGETNNKYSLALVESKNTIEILTKSNTEIGELSKTLSTILNLNTSNLFRATRTGDEDFCSYFSTFTEDVLTAYLNFVSDIIKKRQANLDAINNLIAYCEKFNQDYPETTSKNELVAYRQSNTVEVENGKINEVTITVKKFELDGDGGIKVAGNDATVFKAVINSDAVFESAVGIFYSGLTYSSYSTEYNGTKTVVAESKSGARPMVAALGNIVFAQRWAMFHPMLQLGVGTAEEFPSLMLGGGLRSFTLKDAKIGISAGVVSSWVQKLNRLTPGGEVTSQADLDSDLRYVFSTPLSFYVGLQIKF